MGFTERRPGEARYRAPYRDPLGRQRSKTFARKADAHGERYRSLIYLAVDSGMRWSVIGLRRRRLNRRDCKVRVTEHLVRLESGTDKP